MDRDVLQELNYQQLKQSRLHSFLIQYTMIHPINKIKSTLRRSRKMPLHKTFSLGEMTTEKKKSLRHLAIFKQRQFYVN